MTPEQWRDRAKKIIAAGRRDAYLRAKLWSSFTAFPANYGPINPDELDEIDEVLREEMLSVQALFLCAYSLCRERGLDLKEELEECRRITGLKEPKLINFSIPEQGKARKGKR